MGGRATIVTIAVFFILLILSRFMPFWFNVPYNLSILGAVTLFGGAYLGKSLKTMALVLAGIWLSDVVINMQYFEGITLFYEGYIFTVLSYIVTIAIGYYTLRENKSTGNIIGAGMFSAIAFFIISNFGTWIGTSLYTKDLNGLLQSYIAGIPFFRGTLFGNVIFTFIFVKTFEYFMVSVPGTEKVKA